MKNRFLNNLSLLGALALATSLNPALASEPGRPDPDAGLLAAIDIQTNILLEGAVFGDFETWYPEIYPGFGWTRESTEVGSNGLFRIDYTVYDLQANRHARQPVPIDALSILAFRPGAPAGRVFPPAPPAPERRAFRADCRSSRPTPSEQVIKLIEDALVTAQSFATNARYYSFLGNSQSLSFVSHLPEPFPGLETFGGAAVRRVSFRLQPSRHRRPELTMEHAPLLVALRPGQVEPFRATLAADVSVFHLQYWDASAAEWVERWTNTNSLPQMVQVTLGLGHPQGRDRLPDDLNSRIVALPATTVAADISSPAVTNRPPMYAPIHRLPTNWPPNEFFPRLAVPPPIAVAEGGGTLSDGARGNPPHLRRHHSRRDPSRDAELEWLGRSGVELARYVLANDGLGPFGQIDSKQSKWAGGPGDLNGPLAELDLGHYELGKGTISLRIMDQESKFNINATDEIILRQALTVIGADAAEIPAIADSILDWRDPDSNQHPAGAESADYLSLFPPYFAKNGPLDELSELLLVKGVTPGMYWGLSASGPGPFFAVGLVDLFTPLSGGLVNINTASATVLRVIPEFDDVTAYAIIVARAGPDGVEGTEDDTPFRNLNELARVPSLNPAFIPRLRRYFTVTSLVFEALVEARLDHETRHFVALLRRNSPHDVQLLHLYWR